VLFTGRSEMRLRSTRHGASTARPAALPAPVASAAAHAEAEARPFLNAAAGAAPPAAKAVAVPAVHPKKPVRRSKAAPRTKS
jgi:hypothetical protein